ncbi:NmrA family NAD(P)-binding protein [Microbacterium sp. XT11]|uniref:NmrA family NAD(P)-binding protein n=1 Tax=Microbacterium sp. XT11 TaxID=367477 RepID=UPI00074307E7|nr:NAD(P)H-binding protein [Microbacterium sp. XT11]ALX66154.1 hypothetical protein AB663_001083 [Microbacterium sp. XT11]
MIVVTTPTGRVGRRLVSHLLERGSAVRVIVRDGNQLDSGIRERVDIVEGTHADERVLDRALRGAEALFWLVPPDPTAPSAEEHYLRFARAGAASIRRNRVGRVVAVTSAGHGWRGPAGLLSAAFMMDAELRATGAAFRAISLPFYMENLAGQLDGMRTRGTLSLTFAPDRPLAMVATRDIAAHAADLLTDPSWSGQQDVPLFAPDRWTPDDIARVLSEEIGSPVAYRRMSIDDFAGMLRARGAGERAIRDTVEMFAAQDQGIYDEDWKTATIAATDFRTWCREELLIGTDEHPAGARRRTGADAVLPS